MIVGTIAATVVSLMMPRQYETSLLLQVGAVNDRQLEESYTVTEIINSDSFRQSVAATLKEEASRKQLSKMIQAETNMLRPSPMVPVHVLADAPERAVQMAEAVADAVKDRHQKMFDAKMVYYKTYAGELANKIDAATQEATDLRKDLATFRSSRDANVASILLLETRLSDKELQIVNWKRELRESLAYLTSAHSHNTAMVAPPILPRKAAKPNVMLNVIIGFFGSLLVMISFVLLFEQYTKASPRI